jgi:hypothetical protein
MLGLMKRLFLLLVVTGFAGAILAGDLVVINGQTANVLNAAIIDNTAAAPPSWVQGNYAVPSGTSTTNSVTLTNSQTAGNCNLVWIVISNAAAFGTVTDTAGNTYSLVYGPINNGPGAWHTALFVSNNIHPASAGNVVTATYASSGWCEMLVSEYTSVASGTSASVIDASSSAIGTSATSGNAPITTVTPNDTIISWFAVIYPPGTITIPTGFTMRTNSVPAGDTYTADSVAATPAAYNTIWTFPSNTWMVFNVALKPGTPTPTLTLCDNFNGTSLNTSLWQISDPFSSSSVTETGGNAVFDNRGRLITQGNYPVPVVINGAFTITGADTDEFKVVIRTDGTFVNDQFEESADGFMIFFRSSSYFASNEVGIQEIGGTAFSGWTGTLNVNTEYQFWIVDDGTNISVFLGDPITPKAILSSTDSFGSKVVLYNREQVGSIMHETRLDHLGILHGPVSQRIKSISKSGSTVTIAIDSSNNLNYQLQRTDSLMNAFVNMGAAQTGVTGTTLTFTDSNASATSGFYRAVITAVPNCSN